MRLIWKRFAKLRSDRRGWTAVEYGILAGIVGLFLLFLFGQYAATTAELFAAIGNGI